LDTKPSLKDFANNLIPTLNTGISKINVQKKRIEDFFEDFMVFQARVEPMNSMLVNIVEGGSVRKIICIFAPK
jgi:HlyD family secretion protein